MPNILQIVDTEKYDPYASERLVVSSVAVGPTAAKLVAANNDACAMVMVTIEDADVRYWIDGSNPTASAGHRLFVGDIREFVGPAASRLKFIRVGSTDGVVQITYFLRKRA